MKKGGASSRRLSYRPVRAGAAVVGGERCSSLYRLLAWEDMADGSSLRWRSSEFDGLTWPHYDSLIWPVGCENSVRSARFTRFAGKTEFLHPTGRKGRLGTTGARHRHSGGPSVELKRDVAKENPEPEVVDALEGSGDQVRRPQSGAERGACEERGPPGTPQCGREGFQNPGSRSRHCRCWALGASADAALLRLSRLLRCAAAACRTPAQRGRQRRRAARVATSTGRARTARKAPRAAAGRSCLPRRARPPAFRSGCGVHKLGPGVDLPDLQADRVYEPDGLDAEAISGSRRSCRGRSSP